MTTILIIMGIAGVSLLCLVYYALARIAAISDEWQDRICEKLWPGEKEDKEGLPG